MNNIKLCEILSRELEDANGFLDIGCGDGFLVCCLARRLNKKIVGLDIAIKGFTRARKYCKRFDVCNLIECTKGDAHDMRMFKNNEFDAVTLIYALHHMIDPKVVLREAKRVLKPNGKIVAIEYVVKKKKKQMPQVCERRD